MTQDEILNELKKISDYYFNKENYISAGQINLAMDVIDDYYCYEILQQFDGVKSVCICKTDKRHQANFEGENCLYCGEQIFLTTLNKDK